MKMYVTSRFKNALESKREIEELCQAVRAAGYVDFHFIRDVEHFNPAHFKTQQEVWRASLDSLSACDALLIDVTDMPTGGRVVEVGMAFALGKAIYVAHKVGTDYKSFYAGIATRIIAYESFDDITAQLRA